ncbi:MAG: GNAT family N-acetyltransferase [Clostridiales bacterium]|nr:GNAT family N-acetyltransferase [Clostridiales bacterium]
MYKIIEWNPEDIVAIKSTWEKLTKHHESVSNYFSDYFSDYPFSVREEKLRKHGKNGMTKIDLIIDDSNNQTYGHCISIIDSDGKGELESLYVSNHLRGKRFGKSLVERAIIWFEEHQINEFNIEVAVGNEEVLQFYEQFGYQPFSYNLKKR